MERAANGIISIVLLSGTPITMLLSVYLSVDLSRPEKKSFIETATIGQYRSGSSPKIMGGHCPIMPFITESIFSILRNGKDTNFIDLHLKSVISRVANSVMG